MHLIILYNYFPPLLYSFGFIQMFGYLLVLITIPPSRFRVEPCAIY